MDDETARGPAPGGRQTTVERTSDREAVVTRTFDAPAHLVYRAWTTPELLKLWWAPKSFGVYMVSCEADVRPGGAYRFVMGHPSLEEPMAFFGRYLEADPPRRLVWTNEEGAEGGQVTTVTFETTGGQTRLVMHDLYPSKAALDEAVADQSMTGFCETFDQLDAFLLEP